MVRKIRQLLTIPRAIYHYHRGHLTLPYLPTALWIEPTNTCNLGCVMCPNSVVVQENPGFMDLELYRKIIDEAKDFTAYTVLCISGESLLHPEFPEMVSYAKANGIDTYLSTNCTKLTPDLSRQLLEAGLDWINFSFDGCTKEVYERVRVGANFEEALQNVVDFLKVKRELGAKTHAELQILVMDQEGFQNYRENISQFRTNFADLPLDYIQVRRPSTWGGFLAGTDKFQPRTLSKQYSPCSYLWSSLHLLWDGKVVACTSDFFGENVLGKFPEQSLREIWNGRPMRTFRRAMLRQQYLPFNKNCRDCDALWEKRVLGLPSGIRGVSAATLNCVLGRNVFGGFKRLSKLVQPEFGIEVLGSE